VLANPLTSTDSEWRGKMADTPPVACLMSVKLDLLNLLPLRPSCLVSPVLCEQHFAALYEILEFQAFRKPIDGFAPVCLSLAAVAKSAPSAARQYLKRAIFTVLADPNNPLQAGDEAKNAIDPAPIPGESAASLRRTLLKFFVSGNATVRHHATELVWQLCEENTAEFIRLAGFGNAAGLLSERGMPGFGFLGQAAVNLDDLAAERRAARRGAQGDNSSSAQVEEIDDGN
jgi:hypothetical protein